MTLPSWMPTLVEAIYFIAAVLFIWGLKRMSSPRTARNGIIWAGIGMAAAILVTFFLPGMHNLLPMVIAIVVGVGLSWWVGRRVPMTAMPQMVALFNGMGGGAAAAIGAVELIRFNAALLPAGTLVPDTYPIQPEAWAAQAAVHLSPVELVLAYLGVLIGAVSFTGSLIAFAKLQGWMDRRFVFPLQRWVNLAIFVVAVVCGIAALLAGIEGHAFAWSLLIAFFALALVFGVAIAPVMHALAPRLDLLLTGLLGGTAAHVVGRRLARRAPAAAAPGPAADITADLGPTRDGEGRR